jgi:glycogen(starch) synthase
MSFFKEVSNRADLTVVAPQVRSHVRNETALHLRIIRVPPLRPQASLEDAVIGPLGFNIARLLLNMWRIAKKLSSVEDFDVVHSFWAVPCGLIGANLPGRFPRVVSCLGSDIHTWSYRPVMKNAVKYVMERTKLCVCVSRSLIPRVVELGAEEAIWIPTPVDTERFPLCSDYADEHGAAFVGRLTKRKGILSLIQAAELVTAIVPDFKLYVCGDGPERFRAQRFAESLGLHGNVVFKGMIDYDGLRDIFALVKVVVLPSAAEGMPSSVLEAMSSGRPVVATAVGDLPLLLNSDSGVVLRSSQPQEIAKGIIKVFRSNYDAARIRRRILDYDTRRIAAKYLHAYSEVC